MGNQPSIEKVIYWNIGIYFGYSLCGAVFMQGALKAHGNNAYIGLFFFIAFSIVSLIIHAIVNFIFAFQNFRNNKKELGKLHLLIGFLVLLIGFPLCSTLLFSFK